VPEKEIIAERQEASNSDFPKADLGVVIVNYCCTYKPTFLGSIVFPSFYSSPDMLR
jgi:hypothetical protein